MWNKLIITIRTPKFLACAFGVFALLLAVMFLIGEDFRLWGKVNDQKVTNYFTAIGAVATALSLYLLWQQLEASKNADQMAFYPSLQFEDTSFGVAEPVQIPGVPEIVRVVPAILTQSKTTATLRNISEYPAKAISVEWVYDLNEIRSIAREFYRIPAADNYQIPQSKLLLEPGATMDVQLPLHYLYSYGQRTSHLFNTAESKRPKLALIVSFQSLQHKRHSIHFDVVSSGHFGSVRFSYVLTSSNLVRG